MVTEDLGSGIRDALRRVRTALLSETSGPLSAKNVQRNFDWSKIR